ncbi:MAG: phospholipase D-like domain-containing protein [Holosporales bacterium]
MLQKNRLRYGIYTLLFLSGYCLAFLRMPPSPNFEPVNPTSDSVIDVCFSPNGECEERIIKGIRRAKKQVLIHAFALTSPIITQELIKAHKAGITVRILYDRSQARHHASKISYLKSQGIETIPDRISGLSHNKVIILDDWGVITGSYNFTNAANAKNAENLLLIINVNVNREYQQNWNLRYNQALRGPN